MQLQLIHTLHARCRAIRPNRGGSALRSIATVFVALFIGFAAAGALRAQDDKGLHDICKDSCCLTDVLLLNTGYDHFNGTVYPIGSTDQFWHVVSDVGGGTVPRDANVIPPAAGIWAGPQANSQWIGGVPTPEDKNLGPMVYEKCFCVCGPKATVLTFNLSILSDDSATVFIDGVYVGNTPQMSFRTPTVITATIKATPGVHCIEVQVDNLFPIHAGLDLVGTVTGQGLVKYSCCNDASHGDPDPCEVNDLVIPTDGTWTLTSGPAYAGTFPQCVTVVTKPNAGWGGPIGGTDWISFNNAGGPSSGGDFNYHKCFCMRETGTVVIDLSVIVDDACEIFLDGTQIMTAAGHVTAVNGQVIVALGPGCHCFDFVVHDLGHVVTGLDASIHIHGQNIASPKCCDCMNCQGGHDDNPQDHAAPRQHGGGDGIGGTSGVTGATTSQSMLMAIPNPTDGATTLHYVMDKSADILLDLYDAAGQRVRSLEAGTHSSGQHELRLETKDLASGTYYAVLTFDGRIFSIPVTVR